MLARVRSWAIAAAAPVVVVGLAALDYLAGGTPVPAGVMAGMALMALLVAAGGWQGANTSPLRTALRAAVRSIVEMTLGVLLVFVLAAPLTMFLPQSWLLGLMGSERAAELMLAMLLGVGVLVAGRALWSAGRQEADRIAAQRDAALVRVELAERERELVRAELQLLRAQVEPHFLWNTLANVEYLIRNDPVQAREMLGQLIAYLRATVATGEQRYSTLGSEFESVRAYLGLMKFRMGDRLRFELSLPDEIRSVAAPPLMLQTLVENAIKHGLEPKTGEARLRIAARCDEASGKVCVEVEDNGIGLQPKPRTRGTGLGLRNVRERLRALYGEQASLRIAGRELGGVRVVIDWPDKKEQE